MYVYYNIIWIICLLLLFMSMLMMIRRKRARKALLMHGNNNQHPTANFVVVDMDGRPTQQHNPYPATYAPPPPHPSFTGPSTYRPPSDSVEPPPPSYQDYNKDHRIPPTQ